MQEKNLLCFFVVPIKLKMLLMPNGLRTAERGRVGVGAGRVGPTAERHQDGAVRPKASRTRGAGGLARSKVSTTLPQPVTQ